MISTINFLALLLLISSAISIDLECSYPTQGFYWATFGHSRTCDAIIDKYDLEPSIKILDTRQGDHTVHGLLLIHQRKLKSFPRGIENYFPSLKGIDLEGCGLTEILSEDLQPFRELLQISFDDNKLTELPHNLFQYNKKLQRVDLEGNQIMHVGPDLFRHLPDLTVVFMKHNTCTSENSIALRKEDINVLLWELSVECPPTFTMFIDSLMSSHDFLSAVRKAAQVDINQVKISLMQRIKELEDEILELKENL